jgi:hypothetical protein
MMLIEAREPKRSHGVQPLVLLYGELHRRLRERAQVKPFADENTNCLFELERRSWQLHWLLSQIVTKSEAVTSFALGLAMAPLPTSREERDAISAKAMGEAREVELLTETFYAFAFRLQEVAQKLPRLKFRAPGVSGVRNHLIIHPDKKLGKGEFGLHLNGQNGRELKPSGLDDTNVFHDAGLWLNAEEFVKTILTRLAQGNDQPSE